MSEIDKYKDQKKKLENLCQEHNFFFSFRHEKYPITLTISPSQDMYNQLSLLENAEDGNGYISQDASLIFIKADAEVSQKINGTFTISETLLGKFRNIFKKLCDYWEQYFFRSVMETKALRIGLMPVIDEDEAQPEPEYATEADEAEDPEVTGDLIEKATQLVRMENTCTTALLQRRLGIGYSTALALIDALETHGIVGPYRGSHSREVLPADLPED